VDVFWNRPNARTSLDIIHPPYQMGYSEMSDGASMQGVAPSESYQIDSDDYDSDEERENLSPDELERLAEEGQSRHMK
jgi:hypothetical protein